MLDTGLGTFVTYNPAAVTADVPLDDLMLRLDSQGVRHLPVVDAQRRVLGMVSDLDVSRAVLTWRAWKGAAVLAGVAPTVDDILVRRTTSIDTRESPRSALAKFREHRVDALPVVDEGRLVGILTSSDFLREFSYGEFDGCDQTVGDHMHQDDRVAVDTTTPWREVQATMQQRGMEHLIAVRGLCPIGVISLRDLRRTSEDLPPDGQLGQIKAIDLLNKTSAVLRPTHRLAEAAALMLEVRLKALPVVNRANHLVGLLTEDDILAVVDQHYEASSSLDSCGVPGDQR
jgi:CBS domain-containing protein